MNILSNNFPYNNQAWKLGRYGFAIIHTKYTCGNWVFFPVNTGTQLNIANFTSLYPFIYFDSTYGEEKPTRDPTKLKLKFTVNRAATADFRLHAIVLYEEDIVVDKMGDQRVIV